MGKSYVLSLIAERTGEALTWLGDRTALLLDLVEWFAANIWKY
ncbi:hypothetical protein [Rhizobium leguminosarum]|nr:hypothetical protein [Rhizobium leguminosarum]